MTIKPFIRTILLITLIAGTLDLLSAFTHIYIKTGHIANRMFHYIAGGVLGLERSMQGGVGVVLLGIFIHYLIAFLFTLFFFLIYPKVPVLRKNRYVSGIVYGLFVFVMMNYVVLPLTALPYQPPHFPDAFVGVVMLPLIVGLPIAIGAYRYYNNYVYAKQFSR